MESTNENRNNRNRRANRMGYRVQRYPIRRHYCGVVSLVIAAVLAAILVIILDL